MKDDKLVIGGHEFSSRFILGSGKYSLSLIEAAVKYADKIGLAFQIIDDILDVTSSTEELGKPVGSDDENEKSTYAALLGIDECRRLSRELTDEAKKSLDIFPSGTENLISFADYLLNRQN